jgi:tetratricopeptide (TPR) repeat protein
VEIGRSKDALAEIERARQLNPSSTPILADKGFILYQSGKTEEARTLLTQLTASQPDFVHPHRYLADIYFAEGNYAGYFDEEKIALRMRRNPALEKTLDAEEQGYASSGLPGLLDARLHFAQAAFERGNGSAFEVAEAHAALGQNDDAMKYLQIAYQRHDLSLAELPVNQWFKTLHRDQEFRDLLTKIGLPIAD